ncbi:hypothetical protein GCM10022233_68040 [Streptomyces shaanxiensis]|uniref:Uncharacterized protein n=1 Tax=Streptomyces shaanxiensis TaxID=653357 RepID=A0ABP7W293_9ACTN
MTNVAVVTVVADRSRERRSSLLLTAADGRQGLLIRSAARRRRDFPDPASSTPATPHRSTTTPHGTPVPFSAHHTPRAIRVRRSPR